jgi:hypothetical protein
MMGSEDNAPIATPPINAGISLPGVSFIETFDLIGWFYLSQFS